MRILHLLASPFWSGPAENVVELALAQRALGHEVTVAIDRKRSRVAAEEEAAPHLEAQGLLDSSGLELSVKSTPLGWKRDLQVLARSDAEVIHAHFSHDHLLAAVAGRLRRARQILIRSIHAPRSLRRSTPRASAFTVPFSALAAKVRRTPVEVLPALVAPVFRPPKDRAALRDALKLSGAPLVGMVSTFQPSRQHALGIRAFQSLRVAQPDAMLVLMGDGALERDLREQVDSAGFTGAVRFVGYQRAREFIGWLQALDEVWILGLGNDFSARAAAQARACGVRVLAVDQGALSDYADEIVTSTPESIVEASLSGARRRLPLPSTGEIAERMIALYRRAGARP